MTDLTKHLYSQGSSLNNLPRLLMGLTQANIPHIMLGQNTTTIHPHDPPSLVIEVLLTDAGFQKFHQVFVGQRFVPIDTDCQRFFWDCRTGLTIRVFLHDEAITPTASIPAPTDRSAAQSTTRPPRKQSRQHPALQEWLGNAEMLISHHQGVFLTT